MSRPMTALMIGAVIAVALPAIPGSVNAAELPIPPPVAQQGERVASCGPCGCLHVTYDYHRELNSTYGLGFDPRNYDTTEPHYYLGAVRAYPHYWCEVGTDQ